jgi:hypothetical protein
LSFPANSDSVALSGAQFEFTLAAIAQNLRRLAKLMTRAPPENLAACLA